MAAHQIYFHLTWSTYRRMPMIDGPTRNFLDGYFRRILIQERLSLTALAFLRTHVHLLVQSGPRFDLSRLVQLLKGGSSYAASRQPDNRLGLRWNREYSVTSVSPKLVTTAIEYIKRQDQRHPAESIPR
jgi:REP element-mobilizing transposase RayT